MHFFIERARQSFQDKQVVTDLSLR
jgi:hypothetical protein